MLTNLPLQKKMKPTTTGHRINKMTIYPSPQSTGKELEIHGSFCFYGLEKLCKWLPMIKQLIILYTSCITPFEICLIISLSTKPNCKSSINMQCLEYGFNRTWEMFLTFQPSRECSGHKTDMILNEIPSARHRRRNSNEDDDDEEDRETC